LKEIGVYFGIGESGACHAGGRVKKRMKRDCRIDKKIEALENRIMSTAPSSTIRIWMRSLIGITNRTSSAGWTAIKPRLRRHRQEGEEVKPRENYYVATFWTNLKNAD
jgi:hypothetical protein